MDLGKLYIKTPGQDNEAIGSKIPIAGRAAVREVSPDPTG
jgi:hypothetical protein